MTIQPYDVRVAFGKPVAPVKNENALADYLAKIKAKYGDDALTRLHKMENKARRNRDGNVTMDTCETAKENGRKRSGGNLPSKEDRKDFVLSAMPASSDALAKMAGISPGYVADLLAELKSEGRCRFRRVNGNRTLWERLPVEFSK